MIINVCFDHGDHGESQKKHYDSLSGSSQQTWTKKPLHGITPLPQYVTQPTEVLVLLQVVVLVELLVRVTSQH